MTDDPTVGARLRSEWSPHLREHQGFGAAGNGTIAAEESKNGRRYFAVRFDFTQGSGWWPRTTETATLAEARAWLQEQADDYLAKRP